MDISSMLEVQVKEVKVEANVKENGEQSRSRDKVTPRVQGSVTTLQPIPVSVEEENYYQIAYGNDIASVRYRRLHCTACDVHIGSAPSQVHNMLEHPVLRTLLCARCREFYGDGFFEQGDDATDMFCRWCANGGNLYCCSYCSNTFCYKCIRRNFVSLIRKKIEADEKWQCFVCNPTDLYDARALCWALLQHIHTVTSILQNSKYMSREEIEEKMNLDESQCCPRRSKRKQKRRLESNSEEEDETYVPKVNGIPIIVKRKPHKKIKPRYSAPNGAKQVRTYPPIPIRPRPTSLPSGNQMKEQQQHEVKVKVERQKATAGVEPPKKSAVVSPPRTINSSAPTRYDSSPLPPPLYHTTLLNQTSASTTYVRPIGPSVDRNLMNPMFHQIILPPPPASQVPVIQQKPSQSLRNAANAMVSISNPAESRFGPRLIFPQARNPDVTLTPNIIELDSDSDDDDDDEPKIVEQRDNCPSDNAPSNTGTADVSNKVIPVALFSTENDIREEQPLKEMRTTLRKPTFSEIMSTHTQELETFFGNMKEGMRDFFTSSENETTADVNLATRRKIKRFHRSMRETVFQLAHINDRVIREYNKWERVQKTDTETSTDRGTKKMPQEGVEIPLNMTCVNESDTESDSEGSECQIMEPSDRVESSNILEDLLPFKKKTRHCGVGDSALLSPKDKATQVYDVVSRDYEKCIGYSLLTKARYDDKMEESVLEPVKIPNENFDKYQEQFIFYLQHIEDHGIETEDTKGLENQDGTVKEHAAAAYTSELQQNIDLFTASVGQPENCNEVGNSTSLIDSEAYDKADVDTPDHGKTSNNSDSNSKIRFTDMQLSGGIRKIKLQKIQNGATTLSNDDVSSSKNADEVVRTEAAVKARESEEDCTIIDD
ncbi:PREDICTED: uncharacterized protein LOC106750466 isoform X2 [Dinoponera quadriceps]|uniref:Uncharacterized protein LOC106750466 isoform X2 n=1 Tax=Dinoponera quadriceps TaxID=609295 RepID=A0A6P3Y8J9_DINQU|nr:PREDICTED: uncharacterized protein LOC106750466 isoform X2 [Dinoponera quadriceps]